MFFSQIFKENAIKTHTKIYKNTHCIFPIHFMCFFARNGVILEKYFLAHFFVEVKSWKNARWKRRNPPGRRRESFSLHSQHRCLLSIHMFFRFRKKKSEKKYFRSDFASDPKKNAFELIFFCKKVRTRPVKTTEWNSVSSCTVRYRIPFCSFHRSCPDFLNHYGMKKSKNARGTFLGLFHAIQFFCATFFSQPRKGKSRERQ